MGHNVLIVDDSSTMRSIIKRTLRMADLPLDELLDAGSGKEALEVMAQEEVNLVLADINMPEMSGIEMVEHMQNNENIRDIPVIIISTEASTTRIEELKGKGVKGYVHKPFTPEDIRAVINDVLGVCHAGNE